MPLGFGKSILATSAVAGFTGITITVNGDVEKDTAFVKYGTACAEFGNTTRDGELIAEDVILEIPSYRTGDWTWECWAHIDADESSQNFFTNRSDTSYNNGDLTVYRVGPAPFNDQVRFFGKDSTGVGFSINGSTTLMSSLNTWYHIAAQRYNGDFELFVNGISQGTTSGLSGDLYFSATPGSGQNDLYMGSLGQATTQGLNGGMDEIRISKVARYTSGNFTPPTGAFTRDSDTVCLIHCDGTDGATDFEDSET